MGRRKFTSRVDGFKARKPHWVCQSCGTVFTVSKPDRCSHCLADDRVFTYFPSKREFQRFQQLRLLELAGEITDIEIHPSWSLSIAGKAFRVELDFAYTERGRRVYEDVKSSGTDTGLSQIKRAILEEREGIEVVLV